ncbi:MAG: HAD family hydrolase [Vicinamibacterales bacterium]|nr:HAD family hydrolase [Vicinamibacterales bacterium]
MTEAVLFDVDFTLIYPGRVFQGDGYAECGLRYGMTLDPARFDAAVAAAMPLLDAGDERYHHDLFVRYTQAIIEGMGGAGGTLAACAREMYDEWALCHHFHLYDDVRPALQRLAEGGIKVGLISNSHRCLETFQDHFGLDGLIHAAVSSSEHGYLKPHPSIFEEALSRLGVGAESAIMVGDSLAHDVQGALGVGMRAVLLTRGAQEPDEPVRTPVPVIRALSDLAQWL